MAFRYPAAGSFYLHQITVPRQEYADIAWPANSGAALGTVEAGVLARSQEIEKPRPIASMTKVIAALAILEKAPINQGESGITLTFNAHDEQLYHEYLAKDGSVTAVTAGKQMTQYQALQTILLPSSNNMTDTLVQRVFGSIENYTQYANDMVKRYGLSNTHIADASGFSPLTVSTPSDMIVIGQKAMANPVIAEIVGQKEATIPVAGTIYNHNQLLQEPHVIGVKPGNTDEAGWCLLFAVRHQLSAGKSATVIGVVMGEDNPRSLLVASKDLLASAPSLFKDVELIRRGQPLGEYRTPWDRKRVMLIADETLSVQNWSAANFSLQLDQKTNQLPLASGQYVGAVSVEGQSDLVVPVSIAQDVSVPPVFWRLRSGPSLAEMF